MAVCTMPKSYTHWAWGSTRRPSKPYAPGSSILPRKMVVRWRARLTWKSISTCTDIFKIEKPKGEIRNLPFSLFFNDELSVDGLFQQSFLFLLLAFNAITRPGNSFQAAGVDLVAA